MELGESSPSLLWLQPSVVVHGIRFRRRWPHTTNSSPPSQTEGKPPSRSAVSGAPDYGLLRATDLPSIATAITETSESSNPLGVKGVGEAAATGSTPAFVNAVLEALAPLGVLHIEAPLTPQRVWSAIAAARAR